MWVFQHDLIFIPYFLQQIVLALLWWIKRLGGINHSVTLADNFTHYSKFTLTNDFPRQVDGPFTRSLRFAWRGSGRVASEVKFPDQRKSGPATFEKYS
jgi:hypothetical protein